MWTGKQEEKCNEIKIIKKGLYKGMFHKTNAGRKAMGFLLMFGATFVQFNNTQLTMRMSLAVFDDAMLSR